MALWTAKEIAAATNGALHGEDVPVTGISIDTRSLAPGDLFIGLRGPKFDGDDFAEAALEKAACVLTTKSFAKKCVTVPDTMQALRDLGTAARQRSAAKIFAVTGSVGKTSTKAMLAAALRAHGATHAAEASLNNHWGVPLSLARMPKDSAFGVLEIGMNHAGEIAPLSRMAAPHIAVITTIAPVHIEHLGSLENIARAKAEIFAGMEASGIAVLPRDSEMFPVLLSEARTQGLQKIVTFGQNAESDMRLAAFDNGTVRAVAAGKPFTFSLGVPGAHQAMNALAVLAALHAAGLDIEKSLPALQELSPVSGRGNRFEAGGVTIIDETHNASPIAVEAALKLLRDTAVAGRRLVALGDMLELGADAPLYHAGLKQAIEDAKIDHVFTAGPLMAHLSDALDDNKNTHYADSAALAADIARHLRAGDTLLVKGSRGAKMNRVIDALAGLEHK